MGRETLTELRAGAPLRVRGLTVVPIERLRVTVGSQGRRVFATVSMEAAGVVIRRPDGAEAFDPAGHRLDLEDLAHRAAGLRKYL